MIAHEPLDTHFLVQSSTHLAFPSFTRSTYNTVSIVSFVFFFLSQKSFNSMYKNFATCNVALKVTRFCWNVECDRYCKRAIVQAHAYIFKLHGRYLQAGNVTFNHRVEKNAIKFFLPCCFASLQWIGSEKWTHCSRNEDDNIYGNYNKSFHTTRDLSPDLLFTWSIVLTLVAGPSHSCIYNGTYITQIELTNDVCILILW